jgi:predicted outer membrane protein
LILSAALGLQPGSYEYFDQENVMPRPQELIVISLVVSFCVVLQDPAAAQAYPDNVRDQAIEINRAEILFAHLAMAKAQDSRVKNFAQTIARNNAKALGYLQGEEQTASSSSREKPLGPGRDTERRITPEHRQEADRLVNLSGPEFDHEFMKIVVNEHQKAIKMLEEKSGEPSPATSAITTEILAMMRHDLFEAKRIKKEIPAPLPQEDRK